MQNCLNAKDLQKLGTLEIRIIRKKKKISSHVFWLSVKQERKK